jgi:hypothetical protein
MKQLKFRTHLVDKILSEQKTTTWRLFDEQGLAVGDTVSFVRTETGEPFAEAEITTCVEKKIKDLSPADYESNNYQDREQMMSVVTKYYPKPINADTVVKLINFTLKSS